MASKLIIKNNINSELQITHKDNEPAKQLDTGDFKYIRSTVNELVSIIPTGATLSDYAGQVCFIKDLDRGGSFIYDSTKVADSNDGTNFSGWMRQYDGAVNVKWFGAVGDGVADDTLAIQKAFNLFYVYIPEGTYKITSSLVLPLDSGNATGFGIFGSKGNMSILQPTGAIDAIIDTGSPYTRGYISDLNILGDNTTLAGIHLTGLVYESTFENVIVYTGGDGIKMPTLFSTNFKNCHVSSYNENGFNIGGGNSVSLINCYAHNFSGVGKCGYRIHSSATMISCTGIDSGEYWGIFGANTAEDGVNSSYNMVFIGCHMEDFTKFGTRFKLNGTAVFTRGGSLAPATGTYEAAIQVDYCDQLIDVSTFSMGSKGATRNKLAEVYALADSTILGVANYDVSGTLYTATKTSFSYSYLNHKLSYNNLHIDNAYLAYMQQQTEFKQGLKSTGGTVMITNLPTADPLVIGQLWNNAGVVTVSAG